MEQHKPSCPFLPSPSLIPSYSPRSGEETSATFNCSWTRIIFGRSIDIASPGLAGSVLEHPCAPADGSNFPFLIKKRPTRGKGWRKILVLRRMDWNWQKRSLLCWVSCQMPCIFPQELCCGKYNEKFLYQGEELYSMTGNPAYSWIFPVRDKSWVWGEVQTNNIENIICCFFFFFPCLQLHLSWFLIHWHGQSASQLPAFWVLWGLPVLGERNTRICLHHLPTSFRVWHFLWCVFTWLIQGL